MPLQQQTNRKSPQQGNNKHHRNQKLTITKKSTEHNNNKSANTPILDRTGEGEADAVAEPVRFGQNPMRSHQIRRDLAGYLNWNLYVAVRDLEVEIDSVAVEIDVICGDGDRTTPVVEIQGFFL